jgi:hypothetical protein
MEYLEGANLALTLLVLVVLAWGKLPLRRKSVRPADEQVAESSMILEALPEGHKWPPKFDEFDGVWESFVCRDCGQRFQRRRV